MPSTPSGKAIAVSPSQLNISWAVDIYTTSSDLQVATKANPTDADFSDLSSANVTSFQHKYLLPGKMYTYRLRACNSEGCSSYSQPFTGTTLVYQPLQAEAPTKVWDIRYGTSSPENYSKLIATKDGGYLLGGTTEGGQSGDKSQASRGGEDFWVVKVNQNGIKQWDKRFGGSGNEKLYALLQTQDGGYLLGGMTVSGPGGDVTQPSRGKNDFWVVKISSTGVKQWDKRFGGKELEEITSMISTPDGNYLLAGTSTSGAGGDKSQASRGEDDFWVVKISGTGTKIWDIRYGGSDGDFLSQVINTPDGGFLVGGKSLSGPGGDKTQSGRGATDYWVLKLDNKGIKQWDKRFGGNGSDQLEAMVATPDGYLLGGYSQSGLGADKTQDSRGYSDYWLVKMDQNGNKQWDKRFGGSSDDFLLALAQTADGGFVLAGTSYSPADGDKLSPSKGNADFWLVKINANGQMQWNKSFGGSKNDWGDALVVLPDGYLLGGTSHSEISGDKSQPTHNSEDYWLVKTTLGTLNASVTGLGLYNATTDGLLKQLPNQYVIDFAALGTSKLSILANTQGTIGSVQFKLDGQVIRTENFAPYSIAGDAAKPNNLVDLLPWTPSLGSHSLVVTPYKDSNGNGLAGKSFTLTFQVVANGGRQAAAGVETQAALQLTVYPNPFAEQTTIAFASPIQGPVRLLVYDPLGVLVQTLYTGEVQAGQTYHYAFGQPGLKPGVYLCRLVAGSQVMDKKIVLTR